MKWKEHTMKRVTSFTRACVFFTLCSFAVFAETVSLSAYDLAMRNSVLSHNKGTRFTLRNPARVGSVTNKRNEVSFVSEQGESTITYGRYLPVGKTAGLSAYLSYTSDFAYYNDVRIGAAGGFALGAFDIIAHIRGGFTRVGYEDFYESVEVNRSMFDVDLGLAYNMTGDLTFSLIAENVYDGIAEMKLPFFNFAITYFNPRFLFSINASTFALSDGRYSAIVGLAGEVAIQPDRISVFASTEAVNAFESLRIGLGVKLIFPRYTLTIATRIDSFLIDVGGVSAGITLGI